MNSRQQTFAGNSALSGQYQAERELACDVGENWHVVGFAKNRRNTSTVLPDNESLYRLNLFLILIPDNQVI
jgi:hypothetical protein